MEKRVILTLMEGSFEQGFAVILRIRELGAAANTEIQILGRLPPAPNILELFNHWQLVYHQMVMPHSRIKPKPAQVTNVSCSQLGDDLTIQLNEWLNSGAKEWRNFYSIFSPALPTVSLCIYRYGSHGKDYKVWRSNFPLPLGYL